MTISGNHINNNMLEELSRRAGPGHAGSGGFALGLGARDRREHGGARGHPL